MQAFHPNQEPGLFHPNQEPGLFHPNQEPGLFHPNQEPGLFHPGFIGLTVSQAQIAEVTWDFGIFYKFNPPDASGFYSSERNRQSYKIDLGEGVNLL